MTAMATIPFIDLAAQRRRLGGAIEAAVLRVIDHGGYIMGPEVRQALRRNLPPSAAPGTS